MSRRRVYLLRHGDVSYFDDSGRPVPSEAVPLNERGRAQASAAGVALRDVPFDLVVTSGLRRTIETADLVLEGRTPPRRPDARLNEVRPGDIRTLGDRERMRRAVLGAFLDAALPGATFLAGEAFLDFHARVVGAFGELLVDTSWQTLLLVAHGGVNRAIMTEGTRTGLAGYAAIEQDPACINVLDIDRWDGPDARVILRTLNFTPYDPAKLKVQHTTMELLWAKFDAALPPA